MAKEIPNKFVAAANKMDSMIKLDNYVNLANGFGSRTDPFHKTRFNKLNILGYADLEQLYRYDWVSKKAINIIPEDATREWITFKTEDRDLVTKVHEQMETDAIQEKFEEVLVLARLYGGSAMIMGVLDGLETDKPLSVENLESIKFINIVDRHQLQPYSYFEDPLAPNYGQPRVYQLQPISRVGIDLTSQRRKIHASRIIRFDGDYLPERQRINNQYWGESVLAAIDDTLKSFGITLQTGAQLMQDFVTKVLKIPDLVELLAAGNEGPLQTRIQFAMSNMSNLGITLIGEGEEFSKIQTPISGLPKMIELYITFVAAATDIPRTRFFGQQLGVLAGASETTRTYYDTIQAYQKKKIKRQIERYLFLLLKSKDFVTKGKEPDEWSFDFNNLWQTTDKEDAELRQMQAQTDQVYIQNSVITPEEVAASRFGPDGYSLETTLDAELREEMEEADLSLEELEGEPPEQEGAATLPDPSGLQ